MSVDIPQVKCSKLLSVLRKREGGRVFGEATGGEERGDTFEGCLLMKTTYLSLHVRESLKLSIEQALGRGFE